MKKFALWTLLIFSICGAIYSAVVLFFESPGPAKEDEENETIDVDHQEVTVEKKDEPGKEKTPAK